MIQEKPRRKLFQKLADEHRPLRVQIELTRRCNLQCGHCWIDAGNNSDRRELSITRLESLFSQLRNAGTFHINITGGEPLLRSDAAVLLKYVFDNNFIVTLQTNGTLLSAGHIDILKRYKKQVRHVGVSLYSTRAEIHDTVTGVPGSHARTLAAVERLRRADIPLVVVTTLTNINAHGFKDIEQFCQSRNIPFQFNTLIIPGEDGRKDISKLQLNRENLCRLPKPWETFMDDVRFQPGELDPEHSLSSCCSMAATNCYITASGDVRPCSLITIPAGNVRDDDFIDIWENSSLLRHIRSIKLKDLECFSCEHFPVCSPCPGLAFMENGSLTSKPTEICRINSMFLNRDRADIIQKTKIPTV